MLNAIAVVLPIKRLTNLNSNFGVKMLKALVALLMP
jgi:hypothetical protein